MKEINIWNFKIPYVNVSSYETSYFRAMPSATPTVEWVWQEMDRVWDSFNMDNTKPLQNQPVADFYSHPVWLMNGIFTCVDPTSIGHRQSIAHYISQLNLYHVADYGGGFGQLAIEIAQASPNTTITIVEPYPSSVGQQRVGEYPQIHFAEQPEQGAYQLIVAQDVLEHVELPIDLAYQLAVSVPAGGYLIFANCFWPVIKCHLPRTFHLRYTFKYVMRCMGLEYVGVVPGATHAQIFRRKRGLNLSAAKRAERLSQVIGPCLNAIRPLLARVKKIVLPSS